MGAGATPSRFRSSFGAPSTRATSLSPRFGGELAGGFAVALGIGIGALGEKHLHDTGRHGVRSGGI
jgi:hypothetical protein